MQRFIHSRWTKSLGGATSSAPTSWDTPIKTRNSQPASKVGGWFTSRCVRHSRDVKRSLRSERAIGLANVTHDNFRISQRHKNYRQVSESRHTQLTAFYCTTQLNRTRVAMPSGKATGRGRGLV